MSLVKFEQVCTQVCTRLPWFGPIQYRVSHLVADLGWFDLDLGSPPGWWAATVATYCPGRVAEHPKSKPTKPRFVTR